jgi:chaperone BCS1
MTAFLELLRKQFENQFLSGGVVLVMFTALLALMRNIPRHLSHLIQRYTITTIDISDHDPAFFWIQKWLGELEYTKTRARLLTVSTRTMPVGNKNVVPEDESHYRKRRQLTEIIYSPAPGVHLLRFKSHFILLTRARKESDGMMGDIAYHESLVFRTLSRSVIQDLILEAREIAFPPEDNRIAILRANWTSWVPIQRRLPRKLESVVLDKDFAHELLLDLQWFFGASEWYASHGIPYQRGYLFKGPPGSGKTSLVVALASAFERDIHIVNLSTATDASLSSLMATLPEHSFVLMEDIDRAFHEREKTSDSSEFLSFSGFLNAIDGVSAPPGRVLIMSTNHSEKLDPALLRPGRADRVFEFCNATPDMARRLFLQFFPGKDKQACWLEERYHHNLDLGGDFWSMADLQEHFIKHRDSASDAWCVPRKDKVTGVLSVVERSVSQTS